MSNFLVSSLSLTGAPASSVSRVQRELVIAQKEVSTGRFADVGLELGQTVSRTITLRAELSSSQTLTSSNDLLARRFEAMQTVMGTIADAGESLLSSIISGEGTKVGSETTRKLALDNIDRMVGALNESFAGRRLFSGAATDTQPMKADLTADYGTSDAFQSVTVAFDDYVDANAAGDPSQLTGDQFTAFLDGPFEDLFGDENWAANWSNASNNQSATRIGETETITSSASANDPGFRELVKSYVMLAHFGEANLSGEARQVLTSRATDTLGKGLTSLNALRTEIGYGEERLERTNEALKSRTAVLKIAISGEEEVDMYEASTRVTNLTNALETSYALTARLSRLSLLNYL